MAYLLPPPIAVDGVTLRQSGAGVLSVNPASLDNTYLTPAAGIRGSQLDAAARPKTHGGGTAGVTLGSSTKYYPLDGVAAAAIETSAQAELGDAETGVEFWVTNVAGVPTNNAVFTVRRNGAATALTVTVPGGNAVGTQVKILAQAVAFAQGDQVCVEVVTGATVQGAYAWGVKSKAGS